MSEKVQDTFLEQLGEYQYGFSDPDISVFKTEKGLNEGVVRQISVIKKEPEWMLDFRLKALKHYMQRPMPNWGADISHLDLENIIYYVKPSEMESKSWDDVNHLKWRANPGMTYRKISKILLIN